MITTCQRIYGKVLFSPVFVCPHGSRYLLYQVPSGGAYLWYQVLSRGWVYLGLGISVGWVCPGCGHVWGGYVKGMGMSRRVGMSRGLVCLCLYTTCTLCFIYELMGRHAALLM